jgi:hypothetical protein
VLSGGAMLNAWHNAEQNYGGIVNIASIAGTERQPQRGALLVR